MSTGKRAYNILRGYINREWDRIQGVDRMSAENELNASLQPGQNYDKPQTISPNNMPPEDKQARARNLLGVTESDTFNDIRKKFEKLVRRSAPENFPTGSDEARQAAEIQKKVTWAYQVLTEGIDTTEKRFRSLELE